MDEKNSEDHSGEQFPIRDLKTEPLSKVKFSMEEAEAGFWTYLQRSAGKLPREPLHKVLNWILEQLNLGNAEIELDSRGDVVSLAVGRGAAAEPQHSAEDASERAQSRLRAVYLAGLLAQCRESGISPNPI
jgi:hypothetical protein